MKQSLGNYTYKSTFLYQKQTYDAVFDNTIFKVGQIYPTQLYVLNGNLLQNKPNLVNYAAFSNFYKQHLNQYERYTNKLTGILNRLQSIKYKRIQTFNSFLIYTSIAIWVVIFISGVVYVLVYYWLNMITNQYINQVIIIFNILYYMMQVFYFKKSNLKSMSESIKSLQYIIKQNQLSTVIQYNLQTINRILNQEQSIQYAVFHQSMIEIQSSHNVIKQHNSGSRLFIQNNNSQLNINYNNQENDNLLRKNAQIINHHQRNNVSIKNKNKNKITKRIIIENVKKYTFRNIIIGLVIFTVFLIGLMLTYYKYYNQTNNQIHVFQQYLQGSSQLTLFIGKYIKIFNLLFDSLVFSRPINPQILLMLSQLTKIDKLKIIQKLQSSKSQIFHEMLFEPMCTNKKFKLQCLQPEKSRSFMQTCSNNLQVYQNFYTKLQKIKSLKNFNSALFIQSYKKTHTLSDMSISILLHGYQQYKKFNQKSQLWKNVYIILGYLIGFSILAGFYAQKMYKKNKLYYEEMLTLLTYQDMIGMDGFGYDVNMASRQGIMKEKMQLMENYYHH